MTESAPTEAPAKYARRIEFFDFPEDEIVGTSLIHVTQGMLIDGDRVPLGYSHFPTRMERRADGTAREVRAPSRCWRIEGDTQYGTVVVLNVFRKDLTVDRWIEDGHERLLVKIGGHEFLTPDERLPLLPPPLPGHDDLDVIEVAVFVGEVIIGPAR